MVTDGIAKRSRQLWRGLLWALVLGLSACASVDAPDDALTEKFNVWPQPPDVPRVAWRSVFHSAKDVELKPGGSEDSLEEMLGPDPSRSDKKVFGKPVRVAAHEGRIFVTDTMARSVHVFDAPRRRYFRFGFRREGALSKPLGIAVDNNGMVYVVDAGRDKRVVVYDPLGMWVRFIGQDAELTFPTAVAVSPAGDRIYVTENGRVNNNKHQLLIFDQDGKLLKRFGERGHEPGQLNYPTDVAVGPDGRVFLLDAGNFRIQVLSRDGEYLYDWGKLGRGFGQLARPRAIAVDKDGLVYVLDGSFANYQIFDDKGTLLMAVGERGTGDGPGVFASPSGIAVDGKGFIYVVDQWLHKVEVMQKLDEKEGEKLLAEIKAKGGNKLKVQ